MALSTKSVAQLLLFTTTGGGGGDPPSKQSAIPRISKSAFFQQLHVDYVKSFETRFDIDGDGLIQCKNADINEFVEEFAAYLLLNERMVGILNLQLMQGTASEVAQIKNDNQAKLDTLFGPLRQLYIKSCRALGRQPLSRYSRVAWDEEHARNKAVFEAYFQQPEHAAERTSRDWYSFYDGVLYKTGKAHRDVFKLGVGFAGVPAVALLPAEQQPTSVDLPELVAQLEQFFGTPGKGLLDELSTISE
jgi:hypothetical protein